MKYRITYTYETEGTQHKGEYITDKPTEFTIKMSHWYGDTFKCHVTGVKE